MLSKRGGFGVSKGHKEMAKGLQEVLLNLKLVEDYGHCCNHVLNGRTNANIKNNNDSERTTTAIVVIR